MFQNNRLRANNGDAVNLAEYIINLPIDSSTLAINWRDRAVSREELFLSVQSIADFYCTLDVTEGAIVLLILPDSPAFISHFLATILARFIPVPININITSTELSLIFKDSNATCIVSTFDLMTQLSIIDFYENQSFLLQTELDIINSPVCINRKGYKPKFKNAAKVPNCAFMQYTSGTTGLPKTVMHDHLSALDVCDSYAIQTLGITIEDRIFSVAKMSFGYGLGNSLLFPLLTGAASIIFDERCTFETVHRIFHDQKPTIFFSVPSSYFYLLEKAEKGNTLDIQSLRLCISAGEALPPSLQEKWYNRFHLSIIDGIGTTELLHIFITNSSDKIVPGCLGKPIAKCKARIIDKNGNVAKVSEKGLLEVYAPFGMIGYYNDTDTTNKVLKNGWVCTGDICKIDNQGRFWFYGRANETFKIKGLWVSPIEIENTLMENDLVTNALVKGEKQENGLMTVKATIIPSQWPAPDNASEILKNFLRGRLSPHKYPSFFNFVKTLPTTETGKKVREQKDNDYV